jgi:hypothetical protein
MNLFFFSHLTFITVLPLTPSQRELPTNPKRLGTRPWFNKFFYPYTFYSNGISLVHRECDRVTASANDSAVGQFPSRT